MVVGKQIVPVLRSYDEAKAKEFYIDFLGFSVDFEHRFGPDAPLYMGLSLGPVELHLSEHFGDGTPGSVVRLEVESRLAEFCEQLNAKRYKNAGPGLQEQSWGLLEMSIADPFGNKLVFCETLPASETAKE